MAFRRKSYEEQYNVLKAINTKLWMLPCHGQHDDGEEAFDDLAQYVAVEMRALTVKMAFDKTRNIPTRRYLKKEDQSERPY